MVTKRIRLGPHESRLLFELESRDASLFALKEAARLLGVPRADAAAVLHRLKRKGRVMELRKGHFLLVPARAGTEGHWSENVFRVLHGLLGRGYYVGLWSAMNYWGMTTQIPRVVHVVIPGRRRDFEVLGQSIQFVTLSRSRLFGATQEPLNPGVFWISDREKTIVDGLLLPRYCGGVAEVARALIEASDELRWGRLREYVERLSVDAVRRRLGYLLESLGLAPTLRDRLGHEPQGTRWLDPSGPDERLGYSKRWGLIVNIASEELTPGRLP